MIETQVAQPTTLREFQQAAARARADSMTKSRRAEIARQGGLARAKKYKPKNKFK